MPAPLRELTPARSALTESSRYLCFPPAGGSVALLRPLAAAAPPGTGIWGYQYPGRSDRYEVELPTTLEELAAAATEDLSTTLDTATLQRSVLVGFSMGALVALEVARRLSASTGCAPAALVVVDARAPHRRRPPTRPAVSPADLLPAAETLPPGTYEELLAYTMRLLDRDLELTVAYTGPAESPEDLVPSAPCPVAAIHGQDDPFTSGDAGGEAWSRWSSGPFVAQAVPGGHLGLLDPNRSLELIHVLESAVDRLLVTDRREVTR